VLQVLAEGLPGRADVSSQVALREHAVEVGLRVPQTAVYAFGDVHPFPGIRITADVDTNQPDAGSTADDLPGFSSHAAS
jgi:hypothetical protein